MYGNYDLEYDVFDNKRPNENTYLQVAVVGNPESITAYGYGDTIDDEYVEDYEILCSNQPDDVLDLWREFAYDSDVAINLESNDKFIVDDSDNDNVYLLLRVDKKSDFAIYQQGNW